MRFLRTTSPRQRRGPPPAEDREHPFSIDRCSKVWQVLILNYAIGERGQGVVTLFKKHYT
jgi:hypothetical protein